MTKPNSAEFGCFYVYCPIIWTLFQFLFTIDKNYDTLTSERDIANGAIPFLATGTCSNDRNLCRSRCNYKMVRELKGSNYCSLFIGKIVEIMFYSI